MSTHQTTTSKSQETNPAIEVAKQIGSKQPPTNQQLNALIDTTQNFLEKEKMHTDQTTVKTVSDFQGVLEATKQLIENKNFDEGMQKTILEAGAAAKHVGTSGKELKTEQTKQMASEHGKKIKEHSKNLTTSIWEVLKLMIKSGEFRSNVVTLLGVIQELLSVEQNQSQKQLQPHQQEQSQPWNQAQQQPFDVSGGVPPTSLSQTAPPPPAPPLTTTTTTADSLSTAPMAAPSIGSTSASQASSSSRLSSKLSEEKRQQLVSNLLAVLKQFNERPQFKEGLREISQVFHQLNDQKDDPEMGAPASKLKQAMKENPHADAAFDKSKQLVERFSKRPIDPLLEKNRALFHYVRTHDRARHWLNQLSAILRDGLKRPDELDEKEFRGRIERLVDDADELSRDRELRNKYSDLTNELKAVFNAIKNDEDLRRLQMATARFLDNFMVTDSQGKKHFSPDFVQNLRHFMVPLLLAQLERIPIPPIQGSNQDFDYYIDNMVLNGKEVLPDSIEIHTRSDVSMKLQELSTQGRTSAEIWIPNIRLKVSDFHFKFHRKSFPKISDEGIATVKVEGDTGASMRLRVDLSMLNGAPHMTLNRVDFDIDKLKIQINDAKHDILLKMFASIYQTRAKRMIEQKTEEKIREVFQRLEAGMNDLFARYPPSRLKEMISHKSSSGTETIQQSAHALQS